MADSLVLFKERKKPDNSILLEIRLNNPQKLNVLNLEMILALNKKIREWRGREELSAVFIHSAGEKAFCAGGDVAQVYHKILESKKQGKDPCLAGKEFFQTEYEADYMLWDFPKPVVLWGSGIVMGGGLGLFMSASHPIVTETSLLAMPEAGIGFFPDVGASYFLNQIPMSFGRYIALTACQLNASEACFLKLSQWAFEEKNKQELFNFLLNSSFGNKHDFNNKFNNFYKTPQFLNEQSCWIRGFQKEISTALEFKNLEAFYDYVSQAKLEDSKWERNRQNFLKASPSSLAVIFEQLKRAKRESNLKSLFEMELTIAMRKSGSFDFPEGVRALLIEKTKDPKWQPRQIDELEPEKINSYFEEDEAWDCSLRV